MKTCFSELKTRKNRRLGTNVISFQDFKLHEKQISPIFPYFLINNALLNHFLANWLAQNKKKLRNLFSRSLWLGRRSPAHESRQLRRLLKWRHNHSQSPVFGLAVLYPTGSEISRFWYIKTRERKIAIEIFSLLYIPVHWGDLIEQIKKPCHTRLNQGHWIPISIFLISIFP